uniref:Neprosin PEP catalytic domain-containing protein n=1 Tax=Setaria viridis TaxID=4556 RepID=A0A4U6TJC4_SETVI|nr:hypothetical protein SEVIR_8G249750v2 [Setaria viridis]
MAVTRACLIALVVAAAGGAAGTSEQRRRQVRSLLKRLNKDPLATIQSADGDIIDCVPISKQPALDHPLLKNHTIQMRPSYHPEGLRDDSNIAPHSITQTWHQNGKCPPNTIPIRRTKEEDVLRASSVKRYGKKRPRSIPNFFSVDDPNKLNVTIGHQHAIAYTPKARYYGTKTSINLYFEKLLAINFVIPMHFVYPELYGDTYTRLFIYWTRDAYLSTGCYNLQCSGFIQTNNQIAIGGSFSPVSRYGGSQYEITILIWKDPKGGNWWLQVGNHILGYWPSTIFSYLQISASYVMWGGEGTYSKASYIRNVQVVDSFNKLKSPNVVGLRNKQPNCYNVQSGTNSINWGTYIFYGGPGKNPSCP